MATATVEITITGETGLTITLELYPSKSDTLAATIATMTEATNRPGGTYTGTTTAALTGLHMVIALEGGVPIAVGYVNMSDTATVHEVQDSPADLPTQIRKNTALANFPFLMVLASDDVTPGTSLTVTATRSIDGAAFASCANAVTEIANGWYKISFDASDLNGDTIALRFAAATANDRNITILTQP
jgi:hypothetical protein